MKLPSREIKGLEVWVKEATMVPCVQIWVKWQCYWDVHQHLQKHGVPMLSWPHWGQHDHVYSVSEDLEQHLVKKREGIHEVVLPR